MELLKVIENNAMRFAANSDKEKKKEIGQFFTSKEIAKYMVSLAEVVKEEVRILDPGAGNGILSCALLLKVLKNKSVSKVHVDLYEYDKGIIPLLEESFVAIKKIIQRT